MARAGVPAGEPEFACLDPFLAAVRCASGRIDVLGAALALSQDERPDADVDAVRDALDTWGGCLARRVRDLRAWGEPLTGVLLLSRLLFEEEGFSGDSDTPNDPANSQMDLVLTRRRGLPITLALLMIEVGKRAGLPLHGVGFPGRFLLGLATPPRALLFDPFRAGRLVLPEECQGLLEAGTGRRIRLRAEFLTACSPRRFVERLATNLKHAHVRDGDLTSAIRVQGRLVDLRPGEAAPLQERAWLEFQVGRHAEAVADLERAAALAPDIQARGDVRRQLEQVRRWAAAASVGRTAAH